MTPVSRMHRLWKAWREQLWFKPAWWGLLATVVALMASGANRFVDDELVPDIARETLQGLLTIIASSMLSVSIFSLSILVQAFSSAANNASPRALRVVMADDNAQTAVAAFIAAFIYSVIALMALGVGYYGAVGRFVLLLCTVLVMCNVIIMLIRWISTLSRVGRMGDTIERVERAATQALRAHREQPFLGGQALPSGELPGMVVRATSSGHVAHIDMALLQKLAEADGAEVYVQVRPGSFVCAGQTVASLRNPSDELGGKLSDEVQAERLRAVREAIEIAADRSFDQDPRFGVVVLGEIGQRALSAAVNDAGSAITVAGALARVLIDCGACAPNGPEPQIPYPRVFVPALDEADFIRDSFIPLQRDAGGLFEVHIRFVKVLGGIAQAYPNSPIADEARRVAWAGWLQAKDKLVLPEERRQLAETAREVAGKWADSEVD